MLEVAGILSSSMLLQSFWCLDFVLGKSNSFNHADNLHAGQAFCRGRSLKKTFVQLKYGVANNLTMIAHSFLPRCQKPSPSIRDLGILSIVQST